MDAPPVIGVIMRQTDSATNTFQLKEGASIMNKLNMISVDLAKNVFQVGGFNSRNQVLFNKPLNRIKFIEFLSQQQPTLVVMEACYSSHYWGRIAESYGHRVKLLPAQHVTPFVRGNKSDVMMLLLLGRPLIGPIFSLSLLSQLNSKIYNACIVCESAIYELKPG